MYFLRWIFPFGFLVSLSHEIPVDNNVNLPESPEVEISNSNGSLEISICDVIKVRGAPDQHQILKELEEIFRNLTNFGEQLPFQFEERFVIPESTEESAVELEKKPEIENKNNESIQEIQEDVSEAPLTLETETSTEKVSDAISNTTISEIKIRKKRDKKSALEKIVESYFPRGYEVVKNFRDQLNLRRKSSCPILNFLEEQKNTEIPPSEYESELMKSGTRYWQNQLIAQDLDYSESFSEEDEDLDQTCDPFSKYRTLDGSCNNIAHPSWGQAGTAFARILPPRYSDGISGFPISVTYAELPSPRQLSTSLFVRDQQPDPELSLVAMQWGQEVAHDLALQQAVKTNGRQIECCAADGTAIPEIMRHPACAPIAIPESDEFYSQFGRRCMRFVRSKTLPNGNGPIAQMNHVTSFMDCSEVYGNSKSESDSLRDFQGGRLRAEFRGGRWVMPTMRNQSETCDIPTIDDFCYVTGDLRTNQNPELALLHTIFVREHNRIANALGSINPHWGDEKIFQEARRIFIAEFQHITYHEWLPLWNGELYASENRISEKRQMTTSYDNEQDPTTITAFTTASFRTLHSMIMGHLSIANRARQVVDVLKLDDYYFRPAIIERNDNFGGLLRGLVTQNSDMQDNILPTEITEYLLRFERAFGEDLTSIDIQRGRDHGLPGYNAYRGFCGLTIAQSFYDLRGEISFENIQKLRSVYAHVDDIDLVVGAYLEKLIPGHRFGPTNHCIVNEQFHRTRLGDRFFYDNANLPHSFTKQQFEEITKATLARLLCDNDFGVWMIQSQAFRVLSKKNPLVSCTSLPTVDLTKWFENPY